jgi:catechol 2,3-dioxygenase-like lactoylglutathione lyase family enzyme
MRAATVYYYVSDLDRALQFYTSVIGLKLKHRFGARWAEVEAGPITIGLHPSDGKPVAVGGGGTVSFTVEPEIDFEAFIEELRAKGAEVSPVRTPPRGRFVIVKDPDGNELHFIQFSATWKSENNYS